MTQSTSHGLRIHHPRKSAWGRRFLIALSLRRERKKLQNLSDAQLTDIGLTRAEANAESARAPWDAPTHWKR